MKFSKVNEVELTAEQDFSIVLNENAKNGDTVAREVVLMADGAITIENETGTQKVVDQSTLKVKEYEEGWAIVPCDGIGTLTVTAAENCKLYYRILV